MWKKIKLIPMSGCLSVNLPVHLLYYWPTGSNFISTLPSVYGIAKRLSFDVGEMCESMKIKLNTEQILFSIVNDSRVNMAFNWVSCFFPCTPPTTIFLLWHSSLSVSDYSNVIFMVSQEFFLWVSSNPSSYIQYLFYPSYICQFAIPLQYFSWLAMHYHLLTFAL